VLQACPARGNFRLGVAAVAAGNAAAGLLPFPAALLLSFPAAARWTVP